MTSGLLSSADWLELPGQSPSSLGTQIYLSGLGFCLSSTPTHSGPGRPGGQSLGRVLWDLEVLSPKVDSAVKQTG